MQLPEFLKKKKLSNILIVTGPNIYKRGLLDELEKGLQQENLSYYIFDDVSQNPIDTEVERGVEMFKREKCSCIVAVGGGSPMDCAKAIGARIARPRKSIRQLQGVFKVLKLTAAAPFVSRAFRSYPFFRRRVNLDEFSESDILLDF